MYKIFVLFPLFYSFCVANLTTKKVTITAIKKCNAAANYSINVDNIKVEFIGSKLKISGTMTNDLDLDKPIQANLKVERKELGVWIPIPCVDNMGSCTYQNLCVYGYPNGKKCPQDFIDNQVPCRCPIPKGNYTIQPNSLKFPIHESHFNNIESGSYWAEANVSHNNNQLTCYEVYFHLTVSEDLLDVKKSENEPPSVLNII